MTIYVRQSLRSPVSNITRKGPFQKKKKSKRSPQKQSVFAYSENSLIEHSSWMTHYVSLTPLLRIMVTATHDMLTSPRQNLSLNLLLTQSSKTISYDVTEMPESSIHPKVWLVCRRAMTFEQVHSLSFHPNIRSNYYLFWSDLANNYSF